jgi:hypothetical protein
MVMTMHEFLHDMAEKEGKGRTGGDILADIFTEIDEDSRRQEERISKPEEALELIKQALKEAEEYWEDMFGEGAKVPEIVEVVHVIEAHVSQSMRSSGEILRAEVRTKDGKLGYACHTASHWSGTMLDPPEEDSNFEFGIFEPMSRHPWKCFQCDRVRVKGERHWTHIKQSDDAKMAVHSCPRCNGYERERNKRRAERGRRKMLRERMKKLPKAARGIYA